MKPKILILGHARHGKDTVAEIFRDVGDYSFQSSSMAALEEIIWPKIGYSYKNKEECFKDRVNNRKLWFDLINEYNREHNEEYNEECPAKLTVKVLEKNDIYVGMRDIREFKNSVILFDLTIWVDASERLPLEREDSFNIPKECADIVIENNGGLEDLKFKVTRLIKGLE